MLDEIQAQAAAVVRELLAVAKCEEGDILVVGCSSSEVQNHKIGSYSNADIGRVIYEAIADEAARAGLYVAAQCCEHLNRSLIIEREAAKTYGYPRVNVIPQLKAGGSFATAAYAAMKEPVAVEHVSAAAGIDIGDTLIGMHLAPVAVPVRTQTRQIGNAHVVCARTRAKFVGGVRAVYNEELL